MQLRLSMLSTLLVVIFLSACAGSTQADIASPQAERSVGKPVYKLDTKTHVIFQDSQGRHWFAGESGVIMRDSTGMTLFTVEDGLLPGQVYHIQEGLDKGIYFDHLSGVSMFVDGELRNIPYAEAVDGEWKLEHGDMWFRGDWVTPYVFRHAGDTLFRVKLPTSPADEEYYRRMPNSTNNPYAVYSSYTDPQGNLWIGTVEMGALFYDGNEHLWLSDQELRVLDDGRVPGIRGMIQDKEGRMWLSNCINTYQVDKSLDRGFSKTPLPAADMPLHYYMSVAMDQKTGDLWLLSYNNGIWRFDGSEFHHYPVEDGQNEVLLWTLYMDHDDKLWVCSHNAGIFTFDGERFVPLASTATSGEAEEKNFLTFTNGLRAIHEDRSGNTWFGSHNEGLARFDGERMHYYTVDDGLTDNQIRNIYEHRDGTVFFECGVGISYWNGINVKPFNRRDYPQLLDWTSNEDDLWFKGDMSVGYSPEEGRSGVYRYDGNTMHFHDLMIPEDHSDDFNYSISTQIVRAQNGTIWCGTYGCVVGATETGFEYITNERLHLDESTGWLHVRSIFEDSKERLWIGNNGIGAWVKEGSEIRNFSAEQGLIAPDSEHSGSRSPAGTLEHVFAIAEDEKGNIWFGDRDTGVWCYDGEKMTNYTMENGLTSPHVWQIYSTSTGKLWLAMGDGAVCEFTGNGFVRVF